ncbi:type I restriction enzyme HsdR N-terminal domain-containing protein [Chlamydiifrater phoenicopteri]|uniref:type I restriction enzyme HsdR N-terminal domain-containing protein n=1 Tax=Chlamydiifrater phoenicopteri TaxID=2681469 RepID=UPI001BCD8289|nr:type I restriction enzyme HsdR N-terminal domain-containing protein [Chlamydiifrater phoenicopteri]
MPLKKTPLEASSTEKKFISSKGESSRPEEIVRQKVVHLLTTKLGYPKNLLILEKELRSLSVLFTKNHNLKLPHRRMDILVVTPKFYTYQGRKQSCPPFEPLLLVECKSKVLNQKTVFQALGYNAFIGAPCIALTSSKQHLTGFFNAETQTFEFSEGLPSFTDLMNYYFNSKNDHKKSIPHAHKNPRNFS